MPNKIQNLNVKCQNINTILDLVKIDLIKRQHQLPLEKLKSSIKNVPSRSFFKALKNSKTNSPAIIAEIKLASPTQIRLGNKAEIVFRVKQYEKADVDAISVVTERNFFKGDPSFTGIIKQTVSLPVLQKDFVIDSYQVYEAKKSGADAILLIARILSEEDLITLVNLAREIGIESVVEINSEDDLKKSITTKTDIIAVNARNLDTFEVTVDKACRLLKKIPKKFIKLGFSGIKGKTEMEKYKNAEADGVLIGTSLMKSDNIRQFIEGIRI